MSSEQLADGVNPLDAELAATWDVLKGYSGRDTDLGIARRFGGSAAAYSLRDIGAMNGRVVRVRRDSDDTEEDFSANQVASGALEDFVGSGNDGFVSIWYDQSGNGNDAHWSFEIETNSMLCYLRHEMSQDFQDIALDMGLKTEIKFPTCVIWRGLETATIPKHERDQ